MKYNAKITTDDIDTDFKMAYTHHREPPDAEAIKNYLFRTNPLAMIIDAVFLFTKGEPYLFMATPDNGASVYRKSKLISITNIETNDPRVVSVLITRVYPSNTISTTFIETTDKLLTTFATSDELGYDGVTELDYYIELFNELNTQLTAPGGGETLYQMTNFKDLSYARLKERCKTEVAVPLFTAPYNLGYRVDNFMSNQDILFQFIDEYIMDNRLFESVDHITFSIGDLLIEATWKIHMRTMKLIGENWGYTLSWIPNTRVLLMLKGDTHLSKEMYVELYNRLLAVFNPDDNEYVEV